MEYEHSMAIRIDAEYAIQDVKNAFLELANELKRPSVIHKPKLSLDENMWCALLGDNLQEGIAGFDKTPAEAFQNFDLEFLNCIAKA